MRNKKETIEYLKINYSIKSKSELIKELGYTWNYIQKIACISKIKRKFNETKSDNKYSKLVDYEDNISCYWLGFILADGHNNGKSIQINLSIKDKLHILKLKELIGDFKVKENNTQIRIGIYDKKTCKKLSNDFMWVSNKTKNPPTIPTSLTNDQLFSIIIGFIDGDGTISNKGNIRIKCDKSWKNILETFYKNLTGESKEFDITSDNCSIIYFSKLEILKNIYIKANNLNLPLMERKWNRLKTYIGSKDRRQNKYTIVKNLLIMGNTPSKINNLTKFSISFIYKVKKIYE